MLSKIYSVGIYARLSVDLDDRKSESIETQIEIAKAFIQKQKDMVLSDCYTDKGKTGTSFEREGFERMMQDIKKGRIDCIVVKDLSRFGRNHIEAGNYIEKIFPFMGVRFVAVTDCFDSGSISDGNEIFNIHLKNLVNEMYARDIARKVKSVKKEMAEQGSFTGGLTPYGYGAEWIGKQKHLIIQKPASDIVKKIYEMFLSKRSIKEIVTWLYEEKIASPGEYHRTGQIYCSSGETLKQWSGGTVKALLTNPVYTGCLGKEHTHEALVSQDMFRKVSEGFQKKSENRNAEEMKKTAPIDKDIFKGVLFCGECGGKMRRITAVKQSGRDMGKRTYSYYCPKSVRIDEEKCVSRYITLQTITAIVKEAICRELALAEGQNSSTKTENRRKKYRYQLSELEKRKEKLRLLGSEQYLRYRMGEISQESFQCLQKENEKKILQLQRNGEQLLKQLTEEAEGKELTAEMVKVLINRIEVYRDCRVKVIFNFKKEW